MLQIVLSDEGEINFEERKKGASLKNRELRVWCTSEKAEDSMKLTLAHRCRICEEKAPKDIKCYATQRDLIEHLETTHNKIFCMICVRNQKLFLFEQKLYTRKDLNKHVNDRKDDKPIHPQCEFCNKRFFDQDALFTHLNVVLILFNFFFSFYDYSNVE